jgi:hypothetical protein
MMMRTLTIGMAVVALMLVCGCKETGQSTEKNTSTAQTEGKSLKFIAPAGVALARDGTADLTIKLERTNFKDDVTVKFDNLPKGVHVLGYPGVNVNAGSTHIDLGHEAKIAGDSAVYTLKADADVPLGDSEMQLIAKGPDGQEVKTSLKVTIIDKQP